MSCEPRKAEILSRLFFFSLLSSFSEKENGWLGNFNEIDFSCGLAGI
jgi:hypothetical protein